MIERFEDIRRHIQTEVFTQRKRLNTDAALKLIQTSPQESFKLIISEMMRVNQYLASLFVLENAAVLIEYRGGTWPDPDTSWLVPGEFFPDAEPSQSDPTEEPISE